MTTRFASLLRSSLGDHRLSRSPELDFAAMNKPQSGTRIDYRDGQLIVPDDPIVPYFEGVPSPVKEPGKVDMIIFRENTEDVYAGIEWPAGSEGANTVIDCINSIERRSGAKIRERSAIGIKPISEFGSKRLVRKAIEYVIAAKRDSVTLVHKGNIMKFTEGAFKDWGYQLAKEEFGDVTIPESELTDAASAGKIVIKDRIDDAMFQQVLLRPSEYAVLATTN